MFKKVLLTALSAMLFSGCQSNSISLMPELLPQTANVNSVSRNNIKAETNFSASTVFQYREFANSEDINIEAVANQFLFKYEPKDVAYFNLRQFNDVFYPMRKYEITFYGDNQSVLNSAAKEWKSRFAQFENKK